MTGKKSIFLELEKNIDFLTKSPEDIWKRLPQIKDKSIINKNQKNYREAYMFCHRYLQCVDWLKSLNVKTKKFDHSIINKISKKEYEMMKQELKDLHEILTTIYNDKDTSHNVTDFIQKNVGDISTILPDTPTDDPISFELEDIKCTQLYHLIKRYSDRTLIIDIRPVALFKQNAISATKLINIPPEEIQKGKSAITIEKYLRSRDPKMCKLYQEREKDHIDTIVIVGDDNNEKNAENLFEIFTKWDMVTSFGKIKTLKGGFSEWLHTYPNCVTNVTTIRSLNENNDSIADNFKSIEYNELINIVGEPFQTPKKASLSGVYPPLDTTITKRNDSVITPNIKPVNMKPLIDRTKKPMIRSIEKYPSTINLKQQALEFYKKYCLLKTEIFQRMKTLSETGFNFDNSANDIQLAKLEEQNKLMTAEKDMLESQIESAEKLASIAGESVKMIDSLNLELTEIKRKIDSIELSCRELIKKNSEKTHKEPLKVDGYCYNSSLKRSFSSPNLAQVVERKVPQVDRSSKPQVNHPNQYADYRRYSTMSASERENRMEPVIRSGNYPGITGLKNLGNSCYMNSIIQCLSNTPFLAKYFNDNTYYNDLNDRNKSGGQVQVVEEVAYVIKALWNGHYKIITPRDLKNVIGQCKLQFESHEQQDSHEFLTFLLDWMHNDLKKEAPTKDLHLTNAEKEWNKATNNQSSVISSLFFGQLRSTVCCSACKNNSTTYEIFNSLTMSLSQSSRCTLDDCIKRYVSGQKINDWKCPHCKVPRDATKKFDFVRLAPIIVIHLNRFGESGGWLEKKNTVVDFPLNDFNLEQYIVRDETLNNNNQSSYNYHLYATSNHSGTMEGGHYVAYCKNTIQDKWYKYDDQSVTEVPRSTVKQQTTSSYLLFYSSLDRDTIIH